MTSSSDLRQLHREISRLQASLVDLNGKVRTLLSQAETAHRRSIADVDAQRLSEGIGAALGHPPRTSVPAMLQRLAWFELATGSHLPCDADTFVIWVALATRRDGHATVWVDGPSADLVAEAVAEAAYVLDCHFTFTVRHSDRSDGPRIGRKSLDAEPVIHEHTEPAPSTPVDTAIVYGSDTPERLEGVLNHDDAPLTVAMSSLDLVRDPALVDDVQQLSDHYRVSFRWGSTVVLQRTET